MPYFPPEIPPQRPPAPIPLQASTQVQWKTDQRLSPLSQLPSGLFLVCPFPSLLVNFLSRFPPPSRFTPYTDPHISLQEVHHTLEEPLFLGKLFPSPTRPPLLRRRSIIFLKHTRFPLPDEQPPVPLHKGGLQPSFGQLPPPFRSCTQVPKPNSSL